jgi:ribonucleoside-triphosphate reductase
MTEFRTDTARQVYLRTYSRTKPDGSQETWPETVRRVVDGNLKLVETRYIEEGEREALIEMIEGFKILPAGRHLKSSGVNDFALNNCWAAGWDAARPEEHFTFTLLRLAEGGGVGSNYSERFLEDFPAVQVPVQVHVVCDPSHPDYLDMVETGLISTEYAYTWAGAYAVADSREGWAEALGDLIRTAHDPKTRHTQRVYDVSRVRAKGSPLKSFGGTASGPVPFAEMMREVGSVLAGVFNRGTYMFHSINGLDAMRIDHAIAQCIVSGGVRRSARMSIMRWDDDLIFDFIHLKESGGHWTTNISVEVDHEFFKALSRPEEVGKDGDPQYGPNAHARGVLRRIAEGMLHNGEPGVWNSALTAVGEVDGTFTTNPCGEATLTPWEPCNLGSVNLAAFAGTDGSVDAKGLVEAHRLITRYLIRATFAEVADPKSAAAIARYRRIGVGHLGFADYLFKQGIRYTDADEIYPGRALRTWAQAVDDAAAEYANQLRIPPPIKKRVNAPTGSTSKLAGVSGEGIHVPFGDYFIHRIRFSDLEPSEVAQVEEYRRKGYRVVPCQYAANTSVVEIPTKDSLLAELEFPEYFQHAGDLTIRDMLEVQRLYQKYWADQAVSYTVNVDPTLYTPEGLAGILAEYLPDLKGTTVFPEMSMPQSPYERIAFEEYKARAEEVGIEVTDTGFDESCASGACPV